MIILASHVHAPSMWNLAISSGLIAGFVSAIVTILVNLLMAHVQRKNTRESIEAQKENARMERQTTLLYANQVEWFDSLRKTVAKLVVELQQANGVFERLDELAKEYSSLSSTSSIENISEFLSKKKAVEIESQDMLKKLNEQVELVRLYLYEGTDKNEEFLGKMQALIKSLEENKHVSALRLDAFVDYVRGYLADQMNDLAKKIK
jgi:hypothetical protein